MNNGRNSLSAGVLCLAPDTNPKKKWMIWVKKRNWKRKHERRWPSRVSVYLWFLDGRKPETLSPKPLNLKTETLNPKTETLNPKTETLNPTTEALNPKT
jgi:hypothetical protein